METLYNQIIHMDSYIKPEGFNIKTNLNSVKQQSVSNYLSQHYEVDLGKMNGDLNYVERVFLISEEMQRTMDPDIAFNNLCNALKNNDSSLIPSENKLNEYFETIPTKYRKILGEGLEATRKENTENINEFDTSLSILSPDSKDYSFLQKFSNIGNERIQILALEFYRDNGNYFSESKEIRKKVLKEIRKCQKVKKASYSEKAILKLLVEDENIKFIGESDNKYVLFDSLNNLEIDIERPFNKRNAKYNLSKALNTLKEIQKTGFYSKDLKTITFSSGANPDDSYWSKIYGYKFISPANAENDLINIYKDSTNNSITRTIIHELGHIKDKDFAFSNNPDYWFAIIDDKRNSTSYGADAIVKRNFDNFTEDFAECHALLYQLGKEKFKGLYPNRYEFFEEHFPELINYLSN